MIEKTAISSTGRPTIRLATADDLQAINDIYNWYVLRSACTYQEVEETIESRRAWFANHDRRHPITVAALDSEIVAWGALSIYRERSAYRFTCENSVYVRHDCFRRGIGSAVLADLIVRAKAADFRTIIAGIDAEQTESVALHAKFGFTNCGVQKQVGYKLGRWLDVIFMQLILAR